MRIFHIQSSSVSETDSLDALIQQGLPAHGYVWVACARREFGVYEQHGQENQHRRSQHPAAPDEIQAKKLRGIQSTNLMQIDEQQHAKQEIENHAEHNAAGIGQGAC